MIEEMVSIKWGMVFPTGDFSFPRFAIIARRFITPSVFVPKKRRKQKT